MTATLAAPKAHRIGKPIMLTDAEVKKRRNRLEKSYGTKEELERRGFPHVLDVAFPCWR